jgi:hypothetical protein
MIRRKEGLLAVMAVLLLLGAVKFSEQLYRWYAFGAERAELGRLEQELAEAGLGVIGTQVDADSLRRLIEKMDADLVDQRRFLGRYEAMAFQQEFPSSLESAYRGDLSAYNQQVSARNDLLSRWRAAIDANHLHVDRYNHLVDSIRSVARQIGEPYYPIQSPAEIAARHGILSTLLDPE